MREDLVRALEGLDKAGASIIRSVEEVEKPVTEIDKHSEPSREGDEKVAVVGGA